MVTVHMMLILISDQNSQVPSLLFFLGLGVTVVDFGEDACCSQTSLVGDVGLWQD